MKRFLLKYLPCIILSILFILSLAACDDSPAPSSDDITLSFLRLANDEAETEFWAEVIASYEYNNPNVKIIYDNAAIGDDMDVKLTSLFAANAGPDVIGHGIMSIAARVEAGHYTSLTDYFNQWEGRSDIFPQLVELGTYNDEIYGIAYQPTPFVFAYRIDLLEEAGFDRPPVKARFFK